MGQGRELVIANLAFLDPLHRIPRDGDLPAIDCNMSVDNELSGMVGTITESLHVGHRLEPPGKNRLEVKRKNVIQSGTFLREHSLPTELGEELFGLLLGVLVPISALCLEDP